MVGGWEGLSKAQGTAWSQLWWQELRRVLVLQKHDALSWHMRSTQLWYVPRCPAGRQIAALPLLTLLQNARLGACEADDCQGHERELPGHRTERRSFKLHERVSLRYRGPGRCSSAVSEYRN